VQFGFEPKADEGFTPAHFWQMVSKTFGPLREVQKLALFKRCVAIIAGEHGLYLRLPSEDPEAPVEKYTETGIAKDWLGVDKQFKDDFLDTFQNGDKVKYTGYDDCQQAEMDWVWSLMEGHSPPLPAPGTPDRAHRAMLAPQMSQATQGQARHVAPERDGVYRFPVANVASCATVASRFQYPTCGASSQWTPEAAIAQDAHDPVVEIGSSDDEVTPANPTVKKEVVVKSEPGVFQMRSVATSLISLDDSPNVESPRTPVAVKSEPGVFQMWLAAISPISLGDTPDAKRHRTDEASMQEELYKFEDEIWDDEMAAIMEMEAEDEKKMPEPL
jgi:hypothetical protein